MLSPAPKCAGCFQHSPGTTAGAGSPLSSVTTPRRGTSQGQIIKHHANSQYLIHYSSLFRDKRLPSECIVGFLWKDQVIKCLSVRISDQNYYCGLFFGRFLSAGAQSWWVPWAAGGISFQNTISISPHPQLQQQQ